MHAINAALDALADLDVTGYLCAGRPGGLRTAAGRVRGRGGAALDAECVAGNDDLIALGRLHDADCWRWPRSASAGPKRHLDAAARGYLEQLRALAHEHPRARVAILGHTDRPALHSARGGATDVRRGRTVRLTTGTPTSRPGQRRPVSGRACARVHRARHGSQRGDVPRRPPRRPGVPPGIAGTRIASVLLPAQTPGSAPVCQQAARAARRLRGRTHTRRPTAARTDRIAS
jgi:hypothetical protein